MEQAVAEPFRYANLIARHISERCGFLTTTQVERILDDSGLELVEGQVRTKAGGPVDEDSAYRYKQAIKNRLGSGAYTMTRVNFKLVGCRCKDCRMGLD
ncbi:MAG: hypothetical protein ACRD3V_02935 [Vicinamibacteria bacterium]